MTNFSFSTITYCLKYLGTHPRTIFISAGAFIITLFAYKQTSCLFCENLKIIKNPEIANHEVFNKLPYVLICSQNKVQTDSKDIQGTFS